MYASVLQSAAIRRIGRSKKENDENDGTAVLSRR